MLRYAESEKETGNDIRSHQRGEGTKRGIGEVSMKNLEEREEREYERQQIVRNAVEAADRIILDGSDGSVEETNWLTAEVSGKFNEKVHIVFQSALSRKDLE